MRIISFIIALIFMLNLSYFGEKITIVYYAMLIVVSLFILVRNMAYCDNKYDIRSLLFLFVGVLSIVFNDVDAQYNVWMRLGGFAMLMMVFGPLSEGVFSTKMKFEIMHYTKVLVVALTILSLLAYLLKFPFAFNRGISGFFNHSMVLSPMAAISAMICLDKSLSSKKTFFFIILFICSISTSIIAASRGAIGACAVGIAILLICKYKQDKRKLFLSVSLVTILGVLAVSYNPFSVIDNVSKKMDRDADKMLSGREDMWQDRIVDFKESPIYGVGFGTFKETFNSRFAIIDGKLMQEPGSSWLLILSSMGILGIIIYILIVFIPIIKYWKMSDSSLYVGIACFFIIHSVIEGYVISVGSSLCVLLWLNLGILNNCNYKQ